MCYTIDSENVLFNFFTLVDEKEITFKELREIRKEIEAVFTNNVYVDITYNSLRYTVLRNSEFLNMEDTKISCKQKLDKSLSETCNSKLPKSIKNNIEEFFLSLNERE